MVAIDMKNNLTIVLRLFLTLLLTAVLVTCGGGSSDENASSSISGSVFSVGSGLGGVTVTLSGSPSVNTVTDSSGNYAFGSISDGSYLITPSLDGYTFSPPSTNVSVSGANVSVPVFIATFAGYTVSGNIRYDGSSQSGVTITLSGGSSDQTVTNSTGDYQFNGLLGGSYTVTPSSSGYFFSPINRAVTVSTLNVSGIDFTSTSPPSLILFFGDGMGFEHVKAAGMFWNGSAGTLLFEGFLDQNSMTTDNISGGITDSAASATAMATGIKVANSVISMSPPGYSTPLQTLLEEFKGLGWRTGLVTTSFVSDATPAAFGAHEPDRTNLSNIVDDYLNDSRPNVLFGGATSITPQRAQSAGYTVVTDRNSMQALNTDTTTFVSGQFGSSYMPFAFDGLGSLPHLSEMTDTALDILDNDPDGFFLLVENELTDNAGHANDIQDIVYEIKEIDDAVQVALNWAAGRNDTLIIVLSDHETGGLTVLANRGQGVLPLVSWSTTLHTSVEAPVYAQGVNADQISGTFNFDNTDIHDIISQTFLGTP
jgi:alkaline phosphatase